LAGVELVLALYKLEGFMIRIENEFGPHKIVSLMLQSTYKGIEFLVICGIFSFDLVELFTKLS